MQRSLISIVIPAYNSSLFIREAVESAWSQISSNFSIEVIVTDDGSIDETAAIATAAGAFVLRKKNGGVSSSRNAGLRVASGEYMLFLDGDDRLRLGALSVLFKALTADPNQSAVFAMAEDFISPELSIEEKALLRPRQAPYFGLLTGCMLIRRVAIEKIGLFDEARFTGEAVEWLIRMQDLKIRSIRIDCVSADRRLHMTNTGRLHRMREKQDYATILRERLYRS